MKTRTFLALFLAAGGALSTFGESPRTDINPALRYYQGFLVAPDISEADFDYLATNNLWSPVLPKRFGELVGRYDQEYRLVRQATSSAVPCDWGIDLSEGPAALLPHLARCKAVMVGARYRVAWHLQNQRQGDARDDLLAAFTLARNTSRDGTLISVLVQIAAEAIGCNIIAENYGKFTPETLQELVQGIDAAPARGTVAASIAFEKMSFHDWFANKILEFQKLYPGDDAKVLAAIQELVPSMQDNESGSQQENLWDLLIKAGGNSSEGMLKALRQESQTYDRIATIMSLPYADFDEQARQLKAEVQSSSHPLLSQTLPAFLKARQREFKIHVWLAMLHSALQYKLHGEPGLLSVNDPCSQSPFAYQRFVFEGVDRGFQLKSAFEGSGFPEAVIFVEKPGHPFLLDGPHVGQARELPKSQN